MLFVFLLSDCKYLLYFWLRECLKVLFIIQSINMLESINNLHILIAFSASFLAASGGRERGEPGRSVARPGLGEEQPPSDFCPRGERWPLRFCPGLPLSQFAPWGQRLEEHLTRSSGVHVCPPGGVGAPREEVVAMVVAAAEVAQCFWLPVQNRGPSGHCSGSSRAPCLSPWLCCGWDAGDTGDRSLTHGGAGDREPTGHRSLPGSGK